MSESILDQKTILAVDDEQDILDVLVAEIEEHSPSCTVDTAISYDEALKFLESKNYDLVILDIMGVRGYDLLKIAVNKNLKAVMLTAHALSPENLKRARDMGARAYLPKQELGATVPFLEHVLQYDFEPGWKSILGQLRDVYTELFGKDWEKTQKDAGGKVTP